jgi:hypothetical protein
VKIIKIENKMKKEDIKKFPLYTKRVKGSGLIYAYYRANSLNDCISIMASKSFMDDAQKYCPQIQVSCIENVVRECEIITKKEFAEAFKAVKNEIKALKP